MTRMREVLLTIVFMFLIDSGGLLAQTPAPGIPTRPGDTGVPTAQSDDETRDRIQKDMAKRANQERQAALKNDADKLLKLATELKNYVDRSNENVLSVDVVKKAEEIEKLAHQVKEKMKGS